MLLAADGRLSDPKRPIARQKSGRSHGVKIISIRQSQAGLITATRGVFNVHSPSAPVTSNVAAGVWSSPLAAPCCVAPA